MKLKINFFYFSMIALIGTICTMCTSDEIVKPVDQRMITSRASENMNNIVMYWNEKAVSLLDIHTNPGHDSRRFAIIQIAIHDALNTITPRYARYALQTSLMPNASTEAAVTEAAYNSMLWAIDDISQYQDQLIEEGLPVIKYPSGANFNADQWYDVILGWYHEKMDIIPEGFAKTDGIKLGKDAAKAIISNRKNDKSIEVKILSEKPKDGITFGEFRADYYTTPLVNRNKFLVNYGNVKPFIINNSSQFRQDPDYINESDWMEDYNEVKEKGSGNYLLGAEQSKIVKYWSNLKQNIVWNNFTAAIIKTKSIDVWETARVFALIHTAMADGTISMFEDVYHFYTWRPVTAINILNLDNPNPGPKWVPRFATPRVPEYPSSYGISGGATGHILQEIFSDQIFINLPTGTGDIISYHSISSAIDDSAISKIFCGWNFRKSAVDGMVQGKLIGKYVIDNAFN